MHSQDQLARSKFPTTTTTTTIDLNGKQHFKNRVLVPRFALQKKVLVPFWTLEWLFEAVIIVCVSTIFFYSWHREPSYGSGGYVWYNWMISGKTAAGLLLTFIPVFMFLRIGPVVLFSQQRLTPLGYFAFELPQVLIWPIVWVYSLFAVHDQPDIAPVFLFCGLLQALYIGSAIYACIVLDQYRVWKKYSKTMVSSSGASVRAGPDSMLVAEKAVPQRYASAPIGDDDEEVPVSPRYEVNSMLPAYEETQYRPTSQRSFIGHSEKPR